jgi:hypothetical protein
MKAIKLLSLLCLVQKERSNTILIEDIPQSIMELVRRKIRENIFLQISDIEEQERKKKELRNSFRKSERKFEWEFLRLFSPLSSESLVVRIPFYLPLEEKVDQIEGKHLLSGNEMTKMKSNRIRLHD